METYVHGFMDSRKRCDCDFVWGTSTCRKEEEARIAEALNRRRRVEAGGLLPMAWGWNVDAE